MNLRAHGLTSLFWSGLAATAVVHGASFTLEHFDDRVVSGATMHLVDVAARTRLYALALSAFAAVLAVSLFTLPRIARVVGGEAVSRLEDASLVGVVVLLLASLTSVETDALALAAWLQAAWLSCAGLDARAFRRTLHPRPGSVFLLAAAAAFALACLSIWPASPPVVAAGTVSIHVVLQAVHGRGQTRRVDRALAALAVLALVPLALVAREEIVLWARTRHVAVLRGSGATALVALALAALCVARAWRIDARERVDAAALLSRTSLPCLVAGLSTLTFWMAVKSPPNEMLEAGNAGLSIQQWFEHGRLPFLDTFDVHGLSDSLTGFLYAAANGWNPTGWQYWDFVPYVLSTLAVYALLARVLDSAPYAFAIVVVSPFVRELFPSAFGIAIACAFVAVACLHARRALAFAGLLAALAFVWLWRMDLGWVCTLACAALLGLRLCAERAQPFPWKAAVAGAGSCALACIAATLVLAAWRGVDLAGRGRELARVLGSDQAFGAARIAERFDEVVTFRVFAMPAIVVALAGVLVARIRARRAIGSEVPWSSLLLVFLAVVTLALSTRGLVRHTFVEHVGAYVTGFGFALVALVPAVFLVPQCPRLAFGIFATLHALLPLAFDIENHTATNSDALRSNMLARASYRLRGWTPISDGSAPADRSRVSPEFRAGSIEPMRALAAECLAPGETFVDLTASPMLYVFSGARSPHWLNHVITVQGDFLQRRFLRELERSNAPLSVLRQDPRLVVRDGVQAILELDGVPLPLWQARIFDALQARSEPFSMAGRYEVWSRTDWAPAEMPAQESEALGLLSAGSVTDGAFEAHSGEVLFLCVSGRAPAAGVLHVEGRVTAGGFVDRVVRDVAWPANAARRCIPFVGEGQGLRLERVECRASGGLEVDRIEARRARDPAGAGAAERAAVLVASDLGPTARLWGTYDRAPLTSVATLHETAAEPVAIQDGARSRFAFTALPRDGRSVLVACDLATDSTASEIHIRYGVDDLEGGSFRCGIEPGRARETCVFRPGFQPNWHRRPNAWLEIEARGGTVRVLSLALAREP